MLATLSARSKEREKQIDRRLKIEAAELVWLLALPNLATGGVSPGPDHGNNVLRQTVKGKLSTGIRTSAGLVPVIHACHARAGGHPVVTGPTHELNAEVTGLPGQAGQ